MSTELPEGVDHAFVAQHAQTLGLISTAINLSGDHLSAEVGSPEEYEAETALSDHADRITDLGPEVAGMVILTLVALIEQTGDEEKVQAWFDNQSALIKAALGHA